MISPILRLCVLTCFVSLGLSSGTASSGESRSAEQFVRQLYSRYSGDMPPPTLGKQADGIFAPQLLRLIREDQKLAGGEVGLLDHDPLCSCQDVVQFTVISLRVRVLDDHRATAIIRVANDGRSLDIRLALLKCPVGWRISDVGERRIPSLKRFLEAGLNRRGTTSSFHPRGAASVWTAPMDARPWSGQWSRTDVAFLPAAVALRPCAELAHSARESSAAWRSARANASLIIRWISSVPLFQLGVLTPPR